LPSPDSRPADRRRERRRCSTSVRAAASIRSRSRSTRPVHSPSAPGAATGTGSDSSRSFSSSVRAGPARPRSSSGCPSACRSASSSRWTSSGRRVSTLRATTTRHSATPGSGSRRTSDREVGRSSSAGSPLRATSKGDPSGRYFAQLHYLALVVEEAELIRRLRDRPVWRNSASPEYVARAVQLNAWLKENAATSPPLVDLLDTTGVPVGETVERVAAWVRAKLSPSAGPRRRA
jgi:hypothetical protein